MKLLNILQNNRYGRRINILFKVFTWLLQYATTFYEGIYVNIILNCEFYVIKDYKK
jgi:hypothetical protein